MEAAIELVRWFDCETERIYAFLAGDGTGHECRKLLEYVRSHGGQVTVSVLSREGPRRFRRSAHIAREALQKLVDQGYGEWHYGTSSQGGRPPERFKLNAGS